MGCNINKIERFFLISLIVMLVITAITPPQIILAAPNTLEEIQITFNPSGSVDMNITPTVYDYSTVAMETSVASGSFTIWNNGTIPMKLSAQTNVTTDELDMECDGDGNGGSPPGQDFFSLQFTGAATWASSNLAYIVNSSTIELDNTFPSKGQETFTVTIWVGNCSADHPSQTTQINFTAAAA